ncbi:hypothetical protein BCR42DRAFT_496279 [Absidia repens]|uniref:Heterokaryon incompatibility domain-containing protein n=1 Tax=Absidia repens TaxID=90262 RepID=A0A1X2HZZ7_9FUNG|nr:hypothetical protein BCR42DRAFT_496279 [Absidia repens]
MTVEDHVEQVSKELHEQPFQVILIDLAKTFQERKIQCVEKPLEEDELSFVALSYRWGEVQETAIDIQLDYLATITSFDLDNLYHLCEMMAQEPDLQSINYVWVDAICVDQANYERRKATIHQMSNIYEKATYILAVPDLHKRHVQSISEAHFEMVWYIETHNDYIYHLLHESKDTLDELDNAFLSNIGAPDDPAIRQQLLENTDYFADGFTSFRPSDWPYNSMEILDKAYQESQVSGADTTAGNNNNDDSDYQRWLDGGDTSNQETSCPLMPITSQGRMESSWRQQIYERNIGIRGGVKFMADLIRDWSSRVWVISEYHIAKKKNNLKYWFIALSEQSARLPDNVAFFRFDFDDPAFSSYLQTYPGAASYIVHMHLHDTLIKQLTTQSFLQMMLKSKASKHEDRFYAILPQSKYISKISQVSDWQLHSMVDVKLKLFEIMDTNDKVNLLFMSGVHDTKTQGDTLPTFATSIYSWDSHFLSYTGSPYNIDFDDDYITLRYQQDANLHYLQLIPAEYYIGWRSETTNMDYYDAKVAKARKTKLFKYNDHDDDDEDDHHHGFTMDIVALTPVAKQSGIDDSDVRIHLIGSFAENKWLLSSAYDGGIEWEHHYNEDKTTIFNIY